jgi:hypothetical protein
MRQEDVDWIHLTQDRDRWRTLVATVMKFRVPWKAENCLTSWISQEGVSYLLSHILIFTIFDRRLEGRTFWTNGSKHSRNLINNIFNQFLREFSIDLLLSFSYVQTLLHFWRTYNLSTYHYWPITSNLKYFSLWDFRFTRRRVSTSDTSVNFYETTRHMWESLTQIRTADAT